MFNISNSSFAELAVATLPPIPRLDQLPPVQLQKSDIVYVSAIAWQWITFSVFWKFLLFGFILANLKNFPLVYHLRLLNAFRFVLRSQRTPEGPVPEQLFQPIITSSKAPLMEMDLYLHKSNSSYFSDVDVARTHLLCTLFAKGIEKVRGGTTGIVNGKVSSFAVALGAVSCSFHRELKPYESYDMWTRILAWDEKWIYIVTHFVKKGAKIEPREFTMYPKQNSKNNTPSCTPRASIVSLSNGPRASTNGDKSSRSKSPICASALSKLVFKNGRMTIAPQVMLEASGLLPAKPTESIFEHKLHLAATQIKANMDDDVAPEDVSPRKAMQTVNDMDSSDDESSCSRRSSTTSTAMRQWTWEMIEAERKRGLKVASLLGAQNVLEHEFNDSEALGKHTDGTGIEGVVATLAQLGRFSNYQLL